MTDLEPNPKAGKNLLLYCPDCGVKHFYIPEKLEFCRTCKKVYYGENPEDEI